jgi:hypothetical protein
VRYQDQFMLLRQLVQPVETVVDANIRIEVRDPSQPTVVQQMAKEPGLHGGRELDHIVDSRHVLVGLDVQISLDYKLDSSVAFR